MIVFIGSQNPVKIDATREAFLDLETQVEVTGVKVSSGVSEQPFSDEETKQGAINRAIKALQQGRSRLGKESIDQVPLLGVGVEGGVVDLGKEMWTTVWAAVITINGQIFTAAGGRFPVPDFIAEAIRQGEEMGPFVAKFFAGRKVKEQEGLVGVVTNKYVDRTELYRAIIKLAVGLWQGQGWQNQLDIKA